jgi:hypothetical protein
MGKPSGFAADFDILDVAAIIFIFLNPFGPSHPLARSMRFPCKRGEMRTGCQPNFRHDALLNSPNQLLLSYQIYLITLVPVTAFGGRVPADVSVHVAKHWQPAPILS